MAPPLQKMISTEWTWCKTLVQGEARRRGRTKSNGWMDYVLYERMTFSSIYPLLHMASYMASCICSYTYMAYYMVYTWSLKVPPKIGTSICFLWGHVPFSKVHWRVQVQICFYFYMLSVLASSRCGLLWPGLVWGWCGLRQVGLK